MSHLAVDFQNGGHVEARLCWNLSTESFDQSVKLVIRTFKFCLIGFRQARDVNPRCQIGLAEQG